MIFYYIILLLYNSNFANTSFIIDPIYAENTINCKNNTYAINSMISFNNAIIKDSLSLNTYFNNTNSIVLNNNSSEGIQFLNLPIMQPDNYYLTLNDKNILSIYINNSNKINDIVYYDVIEAQNILSGKYENLFLNSLNTYILIGTEGLTTSITIHGAQTFFPKLITSYSPDIPIILSANQSNYIIFNKSIEVVNTVKNPTNNTMIFENFNIKKVIDTNVSLPFTTNITFLKNLEIHGDQLNFITINIIPSNQILNCNNQ
jgi:hypothetical protein